LSWRPLKKFGNKMAKRKIRKSSGNDSVGADRNNAERKGGVRTAKVIPRKAGANKGKTKIEKNAAAGTARTKRGSPGASAKNKRRSRSSGPKGNRDKIDVKKKVPVTAEGLDAEMDNYWIKSGKTDVINKKLDDDMDAYWAKKDSSAATNTECSTA
jgi:hypothetical protein